MKLLVLRLYGCGRTVPPANVERDALLACFDAMPGQRQIVVLDIENVQTQRLELLRIFGSRR